MVSTPTSPLSPVKSLVNSSPLKTEESILLRILVQALVIVGIIATDVAAGTYLSLWTIPLSIAGATWGYYNRRKRNITVKFMLAIGMLVALIYFLSSLNFNDTRLALATLLIHLQVLHSFDLPRRKDLGYSMIIGLILLAVSGTMAQTLAFIPWLLLFLGLALPTLILDYRSRLGLEKVDPLVFPKSKKMGSNPFLSGKNSPLSLPRLSRLLGIILIIGLVIFAFLPRFPGYQLKTFPISGTPELAQKRFNQDNRTVINPGYIKEGNSQGQGAGNSPTEGAGTVDKSFYYGFNTTMNQNLRGTMDPELVMRIRSQAPGFWRVLAFDKYTGQGWTISRRDERYKTNLPRSIWRYRFYNNLPSGYTQYKEIVQSYSITGTLPNIIPALSLPEYIYFPAQEIAMDTEGALYSPGILSEGLTYTIVSQVPYRNRTFLAQAGNNYPKSISKYYLDIPPEIAEKVRTKAEQLLSKSPKPITSNYEKALFLAQSLKQNYTLKPDLPFFDEDEDLVEAFLFRYQGGYADHFSTVLTVMLRSLGIPARLTVGFAPGRFNPLTGYYLVYNTDAYALTEVYFPNLGWFAFDPIPGHDLIPPSFTDEHPFKVLRQFWAWVAGWLPPPVVEVFSLVWNTVIGILIAIISKLLSFISGSIFGMLVGLILAIAVGFFGWLGFTKMSQWSAYRRLTKLPPMSRIYQQMLQLLRSKGYPKHPAQTPLEYAQIAYQYHPPEQARIIEEISQAYVEWRYGEHPPNLDYHKQQLKTFKKMMKGSLLEVFNKNVARNPRTTECEGGIATNK